MPFIIGGGSGASSVAQLTDVTLTNLSANQILQYDGNKWVNVASSGATVNWGGIGGTLTAQTDLKNALDAKVANAEKGVVNGIATLDGTGFVYSNQMKSSYIDHNLTNNYVAPQHIDHTQVSLIAGDGITATGLGDLTASRTIAADIATDANFTSMSPNKLLDASRVIDENGFLSDSNLKLPTQKSVKAYVDSKLVGGAAYRGKINQGVNLTTNTTGNIYIDGTTTYKLGDMFIIVGTGSIVFSDGNLAVTNGDTIIINKDTAKATIVKADADQVSTENTVTSVFGRIGAIVAASGDYSALQVSNQPQGSISSTTVQAAINELDAEKITSVGVSKDGTPILNALNFNFKGDGVTVATTTAGVADVDITRTPPSTTISPAATDTTGAIGGSLDYARADHKHPVQPISSNLEQILTTDNNGLVKLANVNVDHDQTLNYVSNKHTDHSLVILNAGSGMSATGLGDITASRTLNIDVAVPADVIAKTANKMLDASAVIDEDNMVSNSTSKLPTQKSVKAYVDNKLAGGVNYRGGLNAGSDLTGNATGNAYIDTNTGYAVGDMFAIESTGNLIFSDGNLVVNDGNAIIFNKSATKPTILKDDVDIITSSQTVTSVFGRTGIVTAATGDYTAVQVSNDPTGDIFAATVQGAINELDIKKLSHITTTYNSSSAEQVNTVNFKGNGVAIATGGVGIVDVTVSKADPATNAPQAATDTGGTVGTSVKYAREDHKHPTQAVSPFANNLLYTDPNGLAYTDMAQITSRRKLFSADVTTPGKTGDVLIFDNVHISQHTSNNVTTTGTVYLVSGLTYEIFFSVSLEAPTVTGYATWQLKFEGNFIGAPITIGSLDSNTPFGSLATYMMIYKPTVNGDLTVERVIASSSLNNYGKGTCLVIKEL